MIVRDGLAADLPRLARLMADSELLRRYGVTLEGATATLADALDQRDRLLLAGRQEGDSPIGLAWLMFTRALGRATYLRLLLVDPEYQSHGVGRRLMQASEVAAAAWGAHLYLFVNEENGGARRFYERLGYRHVGDIPGVTGPGLDEALYYRRV